MGGTRADGRDGLSEDGIRTPETPRRLQPLRYLRDPFGAMERWAEYGDVVHLDLFTDSGAYLVTDPDIVTAVLTTRSESFRKGEVRRKKFERVLGRGVHDAPQDLWERTQPVIAPYFSYQRVSDARDSLYERVSAAADRAAREGARGDGTIEFDAARFSEELTLDLLAQYAFGAAVPDDLRDLVLATSELVMEEVRPTYGSLLPAWVPTPRRIRLKRLLDTVDSRVYDRIEETLHGDDPNEYLKALAGTAPDLFDRDQLRDEYVTIIAAGHRTTATALTAGLGVLARNADVAERLRGDVDAMVASHGSVPEGLRAADVEDRYLGGFIREVLRLYPPSPYIMRDAVTDVEIAGVEFPEGATVWMPQWLLHRDSRFWTDPEAFHPERWLSGEATRDDDSYIPFGVGPRRCLGQHLADTEMKLTFAELSRRFTFEPADGEPLAVAPSLTTMVVEGSDLRVQRRR